MPAGKEGNRSHKSGVLQTTRAVLLAADNQGPVQDFAGQEACVVEWKLKLVLDPTTGVMGKKVGQRMVSYYSTADIGRTARIRNV